MTHTHSSLSIFDFTAHLAEQIDPLFVEWEKVSTEKRKLMRDAIWARARVRGAAERLNGHTRVLDKKVRLIVKDDRDAPLYQRYFGRMAPNVVRKATLPNKISIMEEWLPSFGPEAHPDLQAIGALIEADIADAKTQLDAQRHIRALKRDFVTIGSLKRFIDKTNAIRKGIFGDLLELQHTRTDLNLPPRFAYGFFLAQPRKKKMPRDEEISVLQVKIPELSERLDTLLEEAEAEERARNQEAADAIAQALAEKEAERARIDEEIAQLRKKAS